MPQLWQTRSFSKILLTMKTWQPHKQQHKNPLTNMTLATTVQIPFDVWKNISKKLAELKHENKRMIKYFKATYLLTIMITINIQT